MEEEEDPSEGWVKRTVVFEVSAENTGLSLI